MIGKQTHFGPPARALAKCSAKKFRRRNSTPDLFTLSAWRPRRRRRRRPREYKRVKCRCVLWQRRWFPRDSYRYSRTHLACKVLPAQRSARTQAKMFTPYAPPLSDGMPSLRCCPRAPALAFQLSATHLLYICLHVARAATAWWTLCCTRRRRTRSRSVDGNSSARSKVLSALAPLVPDSAS